MMKDYPHLTLNHWKKLTKYELLEECVLLRLGFTDCFSLPTLELFGLDVPCFMEGARGLPLHELELISVTHAISWVGFWI